MNSTLTFDNLILSNNYLQHFIKVIWNGRVVYEDSDELYIEGEAIERSAVAYAEAYNSFINRYRCKTINEFYCKVVSFDHVELYIEGEE